MPLGVGPCLSPRAREEPISSSFLSGAGGGSSSVFLRLRSGSRSDPGGSELNGLFEKTLVLPEACLLRVIGILWRDERCDERLRMSCARDASGERKPRRLHWNAQAQGSKRGTRRRATGKKREEQSLEIVQSRSQERSTAPRCRGPSGVVSSEVDKKTFPFLLCSLFSYLFPLKQKVAARRSRTRHVGHKLAARRERRQPRDRSGVAAPQVCGCFSR